MTMLEDEIRRSLTRLDALDVPDAPLAEVETGARRRRRRRGAAAVLGAATVVAVTAVGARALTAADGPAAHPQPSPTPVGPPLSGWHRVGSVPLSHRDPGIVADVAGRLVVLGGTKVSQCGRQDLGCPFPGVVPGGAVFDPHDGSWSRMTPPPAGIRISSIDTGLSAVDGTRLVLVGGRYPHLSVITYDIASRRWRSYAPPPVVLHGNDLLAAGDGSAYVADQDDRDGGARSRLMRLDLTTGRWTELPASRNAPRLSVRAAFVTPQELLVAGLYGLDPADRHYRAEVERFAGGHWQRYPDPGLQAAGYDFSWTAGRLVAPFPGFGGRGGMLDPRTGTWTRLPAQPATGADGWQVGSSTGDSLVMRDGLVFDLTSEHSRYLERPPAATKVGRGAFLGRDLYVVDARSQLWELRF